MIKLIERNATYPLEDQPNNLSSEHYMTTHWNAQRYDTCCDFVSHYGADLLPLLQAQPGQRILDLGCGTGILTHEIAQTGAEIMGIDNSAEMIDQAKKHYPEIDFKVMDGQDFTLDKPFDAVFSNAALHWMLKPKKVIACVYRCLKPHGRFVFEMGGVGNITQLLAAIKQAAAEFGTTDLSLINYYPSIGQYTGLLEAGGLQVRYAELINRPTQLKGETGLRDWVNMFRVAVLKQIPNTENFFERLEDIAKPILYHDGSWWADYVRLRVLAVKI